jgi:hypothetical protein
MLQSKLFHFTRHYAEMVLAMFLGMFILGGALALALDPLGVHVGDWREDAPALLLLGMALTMTVPMAAWMRYRGHRWAPTWEMSGAMLVPTAAAIALLAAGTLADSHAALMIQHVAMFPAMLLVMLVRLDEYTGHHA